VCLDIVIADAAKGLQNYDERARFSMIE